MNTCKTITAANESTRRRYSAADIAAIVLVIGVSTILFSTPLRHSGNLLPYAQDDLYYYLVVARNLAHGLGSTFDGSTPTNGYHPLYLLLLWVASKHSNSLLSIFRFLWTLDVLAAAGTFLAARAIFVRALANRWLANGFALIVLWTSFYRFYHQMEVTLVLPLGFCLLALLFCAPSRITERRWLAIGLVASLLILSRLDAGLLVALCGLAILLQRNYRRSLTITKVLAFLGSSLPLLLAYFWANEHFFARLMPISGAAKQTRTDHSLYLVALRMSLSHGTEVLFLLSFVALCWAVIRWGSLPPQVRLICMAGLVFPFVHWGVNTLVSDWMLWSWYKYSLTYSVAMTLLLAGIAINQWKPERLKLMGGSAFACGAVLLMSSRYRPDPMMVDVAGGATFLQRFAVDHPGQFAMGDRSGMVSYVMQAPMLQTEGLMMDSTFLNRIQTREPLRQVLRAYGAAYYVGFEPAGAAVVKENCFTAREPAQAGPSSPVMQGDFCEKPVAEFTAPSGRTLVFAVGAETR